MKPKKYLYTTGAFAKLNNINKRTLHYYDSIGLFCPEYKAENGYRYYTCFQTVQLELILTLRQLGLSVEEIKRYTQNPSNDSFSSMIAEKKELIDRSIARLLKAKTFLEQKSQKLALGMAARHGEIELLQLPQRRLLLSEPITGKYDDADFSVAADFSLRLKSIFGLYDNFGSRIDVTHILSGNYQCYDCLFSYAPYSSPCDAILPAGTFLRSYCIGPWKNLPDIYQKMCLYAESNGLTLYGSAYEEGLNEMSLQSRDDYITMITIPCTPKEGCGEKEKKEKKK